MSTRFILAPLFLSLAACSTATTADLAGGIGSGGSGGGTGGSDGGEFQVAYEALNDSIDSAKTLNDSFLAGTEALNNANVVARGDTVTMNGVYAMKIDELLRDNDSLLGQMSMTANFGADTVSGSLTNNFFAFNDNSGQHTEGNVEKLTGDLTYTGTISGEELYSRFGGVLTRVDGTQYRLLVDMFGNFYALNGGSLIALGRFEGSATVVGATDGVIYDLDNGYDFDDPTADPGDPNGLDGGGSLDYETGFVVCESACD